jgi:hypothetical protein
LRRCAYTMKRGERAAKQCDELAPFQLTRLHLPPLARVTV